MPSVNAAVSGTICPEDEVTLEVSSFTPDLVYNWYPSPDYSTIYNDDEFYITPVTDIQFSVNATDLICYCGIDDIMVNVYDSAKAGPDVYICSSANNDVILGELMSYPSGSILWSGSSGAPTLYPTNVAKPSLVTTGSLTPGTYTYTLTVSYDGCIPFTDEVIVNVIACCTGDVDLTFKPFEDVEDGPDISENVTVADLFSAVEIHDPDKAGVSDNGTSSDVSDDYFILENLNSLPGGDNDPLIINGLFYIDQNLKLNEVQITMGPHSKIIIELNYYLELNKCQITGCNEMWQGIELIGNLRDDGGLSLHGTPSTHIEDAEVGVHASKDSRMLISNGDFVNNYWHVYINMVWWAGSLSIRA